MIDSSVIQNVIDQLSAALSAPPASVVIVCNDHFSFEVVADDFDEMTRIASLHGGIMTISKKV